MPAKVKEKELPDSTSRAQATASASKPIAPAPVEPPGEDFVLPPDSGFNLGPPPPGPSAEMPEEIRETIVGMIVYVVDIIHDDAAEATAYDGWRLSPKEKELWTYVLTEIVPRLPVKYAILIISVVALAIAEGRKVMGYMRFRAILAAQQKSGVRV